MQTLKQPLPLKWRISCCLIAFSARMDSVFFATDGSVYNSVADQRTALGGFQADGSTALSEIV